MESKWCSRVARKIPVLMAGMAGMVLIAAPVVGQRLAANTESAFEVTRRVTVHFENALVRSVVESIARQAGLKAAYDAALIPERARVTLRARDIPVQEALEQALASLSLVAQIQPTGNVLIFAVSDRVISGTVIGKVIHAKTKLPITGATILLDDATAGIVTGDDGTFRVTAPAGEHRIHIRAVGMVKQSRSVTIREGEQVTLDVVLDASASVLDEVVVTGTVVATERKAIPTPITVITAEEIEQRGITRIEDLFRGSVPGVVALDFGTNRFMANAINGGADSVGQMVTTSIVARGPTSAVGPERSANPLKTYIDGVELLDASYLGTIDPRSIEKIEIVTGPQAATIYGSGAMGGVMQIFTKKGNGKGRTDLTVRGEYGVLENSFSQGKTPQHRDGINLTGGSGSQFSYAGTLSYNYTGQWQPGLFSRQYGGSLGATYMQGPVTVSGTIGITSGSNGTSGWRDVRDSPLDKANKEKGEYTPMNTAHYNTQRISTAASQTTSLNVNYQMTPFWQHHIVLGRSQNDFGIVPESPAFATPIDTLYRNTESNGQRTTASYNTTVQSRWNALSSSFTAGFNGSWGDRTQVTGCMTSRDANAFIVCQTYPYDGVVSVTKPLADKSWGGFGSWQVGLFDQLYFTLGLRGERNPNYGSDHPIDWTPTNGVAYTFSVHDLSVKLLGSYGRATRPPTPVMREVVEYSSPAATPSRWIAIFGNEALTPEYSSGPQGGVELYYGSLGSLTINHYKQKITNLIQMFVVDSFEMVESGFAYWYQQYQYQNVATINQKGWEFVGALNAGPLSFRGTYSWNDSRVASSRLSYFTPGSSFYYTPTHTGNATISYALGGTSIMLSSNYVGASPRITGGCCMPGNPGRLRLRMYAPRLKEYPVYGSSAGYTKSDLIVSQRMTGALALMLTVRNLGNSYNSDTDAGFPTLGRQTLFGLTWRASR